jgi:hypothetical protein
MRPPHPAPSRRADSHQSSLDPYHANFEARRVGARPRAGGRGSGGGGRRPEPARVHAAQRQAARLAAAGADGPPCTRSPVHRLSPLRPRPLLPRPRPDPTEHAAPGSVSGRGFDAAARASQAALLGPRRPRPHKVRGQRWQQQQQRPGLHAQPAPCAAESAAPAPDSVPPPSPPSPPWHRAPRPGRSGERRQRLALGGARQPAAGHAVAAAGRAAGASDFPARPPARRPGPTLRPPSSRRRPPPPPQLHQGPDRGRQRAGQDDARQDTAVDAGRAAAGARRHVHAGEPVRQGPRQPVQHGDVEGRGGPRDLGVPYPGGWTGVGGGVEVEAARCVQGGGACCDRGQPAELPSCCGSPLQSAPFASHLAPHQPPNPSPQDTPGYGDDLNILNHVAMIRDYLDGQNDKWLQMESARDRCGRRPGRGARAGFCGGALGWAALLRTAARFPNLAALAPPRRHPQTPALPSTRPAPPRPPGASTCPRSRTPASTCACSACRPTACAPSTCATWRSSASR